MAVRTRGLTNTFDEIKRKNPKMSDTEAMERAIKRSSAAHAKAVAAEKKAKEQSVVDRARKRLKKIFGPKHSPAGKKYLASKKKK
jgi:hypothetical protein